MQNTYTRKEFIDKFGNFILKEIKGTGIFFETIVSQAVLESSGKVDGEWRVAGSKLSQDAKNLFGIKAYGNWKGRVYNIDTREESKSGASYTEKNAPFRAYRSYKESIKDYVKFLKENKRYSDAGVFTAPNYYEQAKRLKKAGYATSSTYADSVKSIASPLKTDFEDAKRKFRTKQIVKYTLGYTILFVGSFFLWKKFVSKK